MLNTELQEFLPKNVGDGRGVYISTYGCQMNVNDSERMYSLLEMSNFTPVQTPEEASLIIINSCSVREKPVHKVFSEVGRYKKLKDKNPDIKIGVGGCVGQQEKENLMKDQPMIDFVFGTDTIDNLPHLISQTYQAKDLDKKEKRQQLVQAQFQHRAPYHVETLVRNPGVATFVNITKGCDNFCTFCVVPYTRGREKSRPLKHIMQDIKTLVERGVKEVTLLGQNVNSYESECGVNFSQLLKTLSTETGLERIRYTTSHPKDFDQELTQVMKDHQDKLCEYIHLPVQSGSTRILERMNRGYTREEYIEKMMMIKKMIPNIVFSTDIIVGFPGETEEDFQDTLSMVELVGYETIFAFAYSPRPFTKAAKFQDQVPDDVKNERLNRLFEAHDKMAFELVKKYEGQTLDVLFENYDPERKAVSGRSVHNKLVHVAAEDGSAVGKTLPVKIIKAFPATLRGEMVQ